MARPPIAHPADVQLHVRLRQDQKAEILRRAEDAGVSMSEFVIAKCLRGYKSQIDATE